MVLCTPHISCEVNKLPGGLSIFIEVVRHEEYGFVKLDYINIDKSKLIMEIKEINGF